MKIELNKVVKDDCVSYLNNLEDQFVDLIVIDPPYNELPLSWDNFSSWNEIALLFNKVLKDSGQIYIFGKQPMLSEILFTFKDFFDFRFEYVWSKNRGTWSSNYLPLKTHELIWCFKKKKTKTTNLYFDIDSIKTPGEPYVRKNKAQSTVRNNWKADHTIYKDGNRFPLSVISHPPVTRKDKIEGQPHPTQKPLYILDMLIKSSCPPNGIVLDCFMGSGSTAVAALNIGRDFIGCELNETFVKLSNQRIEQAKKAIAEKLF
jgi:DNA modification methylase